MKHIRIDITDDHPMVTDGIKKMLFYYRHIEVQNTYHTAEALLEGLSRSQPDVLLLDIQLPDKSGNELARMITKIYPDVRILVVTSMNNTFHLKDMMKSGCLGYLLKTTNKETLLEAIEQVYEGNEYIEPALKDQLKLDVQKVKSDKVTVNPLTRREKEILSLIATGITSHEIAEKLFLSPRTVENHRFSLMQKLNVKNSMGLTKIALQLGLLD